ncbi:DUF5712 family protein [Spirosoma sp. RP8]|uniref:DUF5712 family protein n=1 Tax=Spirosoma liriopis TaxID=2937440 RepID=A0ABT0HV33_9BACT|nr:DUF5712 family protein [Spirosoma liriopis]MCK8496067.1 DUF5712 family protein [Spirosoma liriopis]
MVTNFSSPIKGTNSGSCQRLADYLEKENNQLAPSQREDFFSASNDKVSALDVVASIDQNGAAQGLKSGQDRFYTFTIDPSQKELAHIGNDPEKLRDYTRSVMENYAQNFGKGIESSDLVWFAKIEYNRSYSHEDKAVQEGTAQKGQPKEGDQTHVHVIVSRFKEREMEQQRSMSLSPLTNHRQAGGAIGNGFDRVNFIQTNESRFDQQFGYKRELTETFAHAKAIHSEHQPNRLAAREQQIKDQIQQSKPQIQERTSTQEQANTQSQSNSLSR